MGWQTQKHNWVAGAWFAAIIAMVWGMGQLKTLPKASADSRIWIVGLIVASVAAIIVSGVWLCVWWWRRLDEASQEAHKTAWYWGGSIGLGLGGLIIGVWLIPQTESQLAATLQNIAHTFPLLGAVATRPIHMALLTGWVVSAVPAIIGYVVVWAYWWWKRR